MKTMIDDPKATEAARADAAAEASGVVVSDKVIVEDRSSSSEKEAESPRDTNGKATKLKGSRVKNNVRRIRIERMVSKAELARRANLSVLTIDRVEKGFGCRMDTKRKILEALGLSLADRVRVFGEEE